MADTHLSSLSEIITRQQLGLVFPVNKKGVIWNYKSKMLDKMMGQSPSNQTQKSLRNPGGLAIAGGSV